MNKYNSSKSARLPTWKKMYAELVGNHKSYRITRLKKKFDQIESLHKQIVESAVSPAMAKYVWDVVVKPSLGYSFN